MLDCALTQHGVSLPPDLRRLLAAVLLQTIKDALGVKHPTQRVRREACKRLKAGEGDWICDVLGLDRDMVRQAGDMKKMNNIYPILKGAENE